LTNDVELRRKLELN